MTDAEQLLKALVARVEHVSAAVRVRFSGLVDTAHGLDREEAEKTAATARTMWATSRSAAAHFDAGQVRQVLIDMEAADGKDEAYLLIVGQGDDLLAVLAGTEVDAGALAYEAADAVRRLTPPAGTSSLQA